MRSTQALASSFFTGQAALSNGVYYLALSNGNIFGYYAFIPNFPQFLYHFDMGYEYVVDANDGKNGAYMYDFASGDWWYTSTTYAFPYVYDFTYKAVLFYYADANNAGHYTTNPRYFFNFGTQQVITVPARSTPTPTPSPSPSPSNSSQITLRVVDYFTNAPVVAAVQVDGSTVAAANGAYAMNPSPGLHSLQISASGYATYNGAIQSPGGASTRTVALFPQTPAMTLWLAQINADRAANGAGAVQLDDMLSIAAYDHAVDMGTRGYFAHFDTHGFAPTTRSLLLGSMLVGSENLAAGYASWTSAELGFMNEKAALPNKTAADCATNDGLAGHYCNIVWGSHNWVGLAIASVASSPYRLYYDQEFGDFYGMIDTTISSPEPSLGTQASMRAAGANGGSVTSYYLGTLPPAQPISIATLNADPRCLSQCPSVDQWYATSTSYAGATGPLTLNFAQNNIVFALTGSSTPNIFVGYGTYAAFWPGGTVLPDSYTNAAANVTTQNAGRSAQSNDAGVVVPNGPEMFAPR